MKYDAKIVLKWFAEHGLYPVAEHRFCERKWRFDFAWINERIALEVEGGIWIGGRHNRGSGFVKDMEKYNKAATLGWRVLRTVPNDLCTLDTVQMVKAAFNPNKVAAEEWN